MKLWLLQVLLLIIFCIHGWPPQVYESVMITGCLVWLQVFDLVAWEKIQEVEVSKSAPYHFSTPLFHQFQSQVSQSVTQSLYLCNQYLYLILPVLPSSNRFIEETHFRATTYQVSRHVSSGWRYFFSKSDSLNFIVHFRSSQTWKT